MLRQDAAECANLFNICIKLRHLANVIINAGFAMIQSAIVGVGRFAEGVRAKDFPYMCIYLWAHRRIYLTSRNFRAGFIGDANSLYAATL